MRQNFALFVTALFVFSSSVSAQGEKKQADPSQPVRGIIQYQLVRTNGSEIFLEQNVQDRTAPKISMSYTVKIPVQKVKDIDGKKITVIEYMEEQRTREQYPVVRKSRPVPKNYRFKNLKGEEITRKAMIGKLGMGSGKMLVQIFAGQTISKELKSLLKDDVIFMIAGRVPPPAPAPRR